jgi:hypothetical protein
VGINKTSVRPGGPGSDHPLAINEDTADRQDYRRIDATIADIAVWR